MGKKRILVSLVSEQAIPTVLFIKEYLLDNPGKYELLFLSTDKMESNNATDNINNALSLSCKNAISSTVVKVIPHDNFDKISRILENEILLTKDRTYIVNLTGGTKIMSIAVFKYFSAIDSKSTVEMYYLSIGKNNYTQLFPKAVNRNLTFRLSVKEYLVSYGIKFSSNSSFVGTYDDSKYFAEHIRNNYFDIISKLVEFQNVQYIRKQFRKKKVIDIRSPKVSEYLEKESIDPDLFEKLLEELNFNAEMLLRSQLRYITGGWFEEFIYYKIKEKQNIPDDSILINVEYEGKEDSHLANNELDIVYVNSRNGLVIVECKTAISDKEKIMTNTLYKMAALRDDFGLQARSYLYTMSEIDKESDLARARSLGITIMDGRSLINL